MSPSMHHPSSNSAASGLNTVVEICLLMLRFGLCIGTYTIWEQHVVRMLRLGARDGGVRSRKVRDTDQQRGEREWLKERYGMNVHYCWTIACFTLAYSGKVKAGVGTTRGTRPR